MSNLAPPSFHTGIRAETERVSEHLPAERSRTVGLNRSGLCGFPLHPDVEPEFLLAGVLRQPLSSSPEKLAAAPFTSQHGQRQRKETPHFPWLSLSHLGFGQPPFPFPMLKASRKTGEKHSCKAFLCSGWAGPFFLLGSKSRARSGGRAGGPRKPRHLVFSCTQGHQEETNQLVAGSCNCLPPQQKKPFCT